MEQFKDAYEISLWEDVPVAASGSGDNEIPAHYEEEKIGVIGSDSMTAQWRAVEPRLTQNVNGTNIFSFKMFYTYIDTITGERKDNPFKTLLVNERKVKVKWKNGWYDFVIKNINEDSSGKSCTYTCQDQFINELSKNGFNLEFDNELGNNMGTAQYLAGKVLEGTDWTVGPGKPIKQYREEPVYDISDTWIDEQQVRHNIRFLVFYSVVQNHATDFQYWYDSSNQYTRDGTSMLVVNGECKDTIASWSKDTATVTIEGHSMDINFAPLNVSDNYRAKRLVKSQETAFCSPLDRYVLKYKKDGDTYYGYETTSYTDPTLVTDYIVNGHVPTDTHGWKGSDIGWSVYPPYSSGAEEVTSYITIKKGVTVENTALYDNRYGQFKNGVIKGEKYVFRIKATAGQPNNTIKANISNYITEGLTVRISDGTTQYALANDETLIQDEDHYLNYILTCSQTCTYDDIIKKGASLRITYSGDTNYLWIEEASFFEYVKNDQEELLIPSEYDVNGVVKTEWRYFAEQYLTAPSEEGVVFSDYSDTPDLSYIPFYPEGDKVGEKIRSITGKNSNRFNWIQTIAETFECWAKFYIEHNTETGELKYYNGVPHKEVTFVEEIGDNTGLSFVYGIDLNTISRTINSDQIATKVIVSPNSNEFAEDGFCTIARSSENYSKANFILDFGYYINQGMLNSGEINRDLYDSSDSDNGIGYYYWLRQFNTRYDQITDDIVDLKAQLDRYNSALDNYTKLCDSTTKEISSVETRLMGYAGLSGNYNKTKVYSYVKNHKDYQAVQTLWDTLTRLNTELPKYQETKNQIDAQVTKLKNDIEAKETEQKTIEGNIKELDEKFYKKYARFIQEGSWISEDYYDDNLYYLDAESVAYTSSRPQIQYNINVLRLSALDEFKNKIFNVGDKAYIEDTEFFGYLNDRITPYKEEVIISEITSVFDSPEQDTITVQNYKTQFEDLFQRITATTQSLQYASGAYNRAASIVEPTGEINSWTLEKSFAYNEQLAWRATDDSVVINATGITAVDTTNPQHMVRLSSAGLQVSDDGGVTWTVGVSGAGISTQNLTAGSINVDNIQILSGSYKTFTWNKYGINAYYYETDQSGNINVNSNTFVRFDRYGLYGINNIGESDAEYKPESESQIWKDANFAVTWKGFKLKTDTGAVTITSEDDISVWDEENINRVKIGKLRGQETSGDPNIYGIRISKPEERNGQIVAVPVMESDSNGNLWLKDALYIGNLNNNNIAIGNLPNNPYVYGYDEVAVGDSFITGKTYYEYDESTNTYNVTSDTIPNADKTYYEQVGQVFNANNNFIMYDNGSIIANNGTFNNGVFTGRLEGVTGDFSGDISAATGRFSGAIEATKGNIGGFTIGSTSIYSLKDENNGIILMSGPSYIPTIDTEKQEGKTYYYVQENGSYGVFEGSEFEQGKEYYELYTDQSINANNNFIVHNDGSIEAKKGIFSGRLEAMEGDFAGDISAASGIIGGFQIANNQLTSTDEEQSIQLNGADGSIIANKITLGIGAEIDDYLKLGNAYIYEPTKHDHLFISAGNNSVNNGYIKIYDNGVMNLGSIEVDGQTSTIQLDDPNAKIIAGPNVTITSDRSVFKDVDITGTLHTAIFEIGKVQAVGGAMIFKESSEIDTLESQVNSYIFTTKTPITWDIGTIVLFTSKEDSSEEIYGIINEIGPVYNKIEIDSFKDGITYYELIDEYIETEDETPVLDKVYYILNGQEYIEYIGTDQPFEVGVTYYEKINRYIETEDETYIEGKTYYTIDEFYHKYTVKTNRNFDVKHNYTVLQIADLTGKVKYEQFNGTNFEPEINYYEKTYIITQDDFPQLEKEYYIKDENNNYIKFEGSIFEEGINYYEISYFQTEDITPLENKTYYIQLPVYANNLVIGINSQSHQNKMLYPEALTMIDAIGVNQYGSHEGRPNLLLGNLTKLNLDNITGYGLYGENVYLTGSLVTEVKHSDGTKTTYAGVNTRDGVHANIFDDKPVSYKDRSRIVFWAGAKSNKDNDIKDSPFQVTEDGSFYARQGYFTGSIITEASISAATLTASKLYAIDIYGGTENNAAALTIHDTTNGIIFASDRSNTELLRINDSSFSSNGDNKFIKINNNIIDFIGDTFNTKSTNDSFYLTIKNDKIIGIQEKGESPDLEISDLSLNTNFEIKFNNISKMLIKNDEGIDKTTLSSQIVNIDREVHFGDKMKYQQVSDSDNNLIGYDLYVS